ncbi:MAG: hypothetical protein LBU89_12430 [Fibromonadaceae bacterium]|jgi:hypothetical protein|nr:hypothetical protein [Fibromonadaceae bacterium]
MKAIIDIPEAKAISIMDVLQSISYLKVIPLTDEKFLLLQEVKESVKEMNEIKNKKRTARNARDFFKMFICYLFTTNQINLA